MIELQRKLIDVALRMIQERQSFSPVTIEVELLSIINKLYRREGTGWDATGRSIVVDAISKAGYFSEA